MDSGLRFAVFGLAAALGGVAAAQNVAWNESVSGDLSNSGLAPTPVTFVAGPNQVIGATGNPGTGIDRDYFRFSVPTGATLASLKILPNTSVSGSVSFIAIQAGPQVTTTPTGGGIGNLLGFTHYGSDLIGTDILPSLVPAAQGGLPSGTYSIWVQETGGPVDYGFEFTITAPSGGGGNTAADVPTLPEWAALLLGGSLLAALTRARAKR